MEIIVAELAQTVTRLCWICTGLGLCCALLSVSLLMTSIRVRRLEDAAENVD